MWITAIGSAAAVAPANGRTADGVREPPAFPVGGTTRLGAQASASDLDAEDTGSVGDDEVADPLGQRGPTHGHRVLGGERPLERTPLGVREADKDAMVPRVSKRRASEPGHNFRISENQTAVQSGA